MDCAGGFDQTDVVLRHPDERMRAGRFRKPSIPSPRRWRQYVLRRDLFLRCRPLGNIEWFAKRLVPRTGSKRRTHVELFDEAVAAGLHTVMSRSLYATLPTASRVAAKRARWSPRLCVPNSAYTRVILTVTLSTRAV